MTKVVVANRYVDARGRTYKGGDVADVPPGVARELIALGKARAFAEPEKPTLKEAKNG